MTEPVTPLTLELDNGIARIRLTRPERRNALALETLRLLGETLTELSQSQSCRVIVIGAEGPVFCAGHDLSEMIGRSAEQYHELFSLCSHVMQQIRQVPQPVIARVHGMATAAGCQLVAACDLAVACTEARFATPGVKIGLFCTTPMVPLVRAVPDKVAMEMLLTGQPISAERACQIGLVNDVVPLEQLDERIDEYCQAICRSSAHTVRVGKEAFYRQRMMTEPAAYNDAIEVMTENAVHADAQEGMTAFLEKRAPRWSQLAD